MTTSTNMVAAGYTEARRSGLWEPDYARRGYVSPIYPDAFISHLQLVQLGVTDPQAAYEWLHKEGRL